MIGEMSKKKMDIEINRWNELKFNSNLPIIIIAKFNLPFTI